MSMFIVGRHTRAEEEDGRSELIGAAPVGRFAPVDGGADRGRGRPDPARRCSWRCRCSAIGQPAAGSSALGASLAGVGLVFAGIAAVAAQVSQTTSSMYGITGGAIGAAYLLRAAGDVGDGTLSWLSPIGWGQAMRPYAGERWWPLALMLVVGAGLVAAAVALRARRDDGAGLVAPRPGPPARPALTHPLGLALRLQRGVLHRLERRRCSSAASRSA